MLEKAKQIAKYLKQWGGNQQIRIFIAILGIVFFLVYFNSEIFVSIGPGQAGVLWKRFDGGTVVDQVYEEGTHLNFPWNKTYLYSTQIQEAIDTVNALSSDGLLIVVRLSSRFYPNKEELPLLHQHVGPKYVDKAVRPEVVSAVRRVIGNYTPAEIYAKDEAGLLDEIDEEARPYLAGSHITLHNVRILELTLPEQIKTAIETKLTEEQVALSYQHRLDVERYEKERRQIEAEGIRMFEQISGISILEWRGLEVTAALATSPNSKIIVLGTDAQGLPLLFNLEK